jgi:hypothetical protein
VGGRVSHCGGAAQAALGIATRSSRRRKVVARTLIDLSRIVRLVFVPRIASTASYTALYAIPRTAVLGAILLTGYLGGAVAGKVRLEAPLSGSVLFGVSVGALVWGGHYLRDNRLRTLLPLCEPG